MSMKFNLETKRQKISAISISNGDDQLFMDIFKKYPGNRCMVIIDENVAKLHPWVLKLLRSEYSDIVDAIVPSGEPSKSITEWTRLVDIALTNMLRRGTPVYAIGGGVTGDLAGFVAASVLRGLPLIHIPTTLLAMVDSAIGGKTGINHPSGKNLIGAFYQPDAVLADVRFLNTLPQKEWNCGLGEIIKYACIREPKLFDQIGDCSPGVSDERMMEIVATCAGIKADVVMNDELETGERAYLNYGHTFAHALEAHTRYRRFAHGEAVYVGLLAATWYSASLGAPVDVDRLLSHRHTFNLQADGLQSSIPALIKAMYSDKKIERSRLKLVLLQDWSKPYLLEVSDDEKLHLAWKFALDSLTNTK